MNSANVYSLMEARFPADRATTCLETPEGDVWTFAGVEAESARYANLMVERGVAPGDRVAVQVEKSPRALVLYLACLRAGAAYLPINPACTERELDYFVGDAEPKLVVSRPEPANAVAALCERHGAGEPLTLGAHDDGTLVEASRAMSDRFATVDRSSGDLAALLYTSGTTGRPKGRCSRMQTCSRMRRCCARHGVSGAATCFCTCCRSSIPTASSWPVTRRCSTARR